MPGFKHIKSGDVQDLMDAGWDEYLKDALLAVDCFQTLDSVLVSLILAQKQLWTISDGDVEGLVITSINDLPTAKVLALEYFAGTDLQKMLAQTEDSIIKWAKEQGCKCSIVTGRPGWTRALKDKDYELTGVFLTRRLD